MVILTIILVPFIALSFDHQNHSKWHKRCHVRYFITPTIGNAKVKLCLVDGGAGLNIFSAWALDQL